MYKQFLFKHGFLLFLCLLIITGCSKDNSVEEDKEVHIDSNDNPFVMDEEDTVVLGSIFHGYDNLVFDDNDEILPLTYDGGELILEYYVRAEGKATNVGFLVYVDGVAQPYKLNTTDSNYQYMHILDLEEENEDTPLQFIFIPVTGKKGETVNVTTTSIYNPAFIPDMKETTSYGGYHDSLEVTRPVVFNENPELIDSATLPETKMLNHIRLSTEPVTQDLMERLGGGVIAIDSETLEVDVFSLIDIEAKRDVETTFQINESGNLHVTFKIVGHPGVSYQNTFYLNHEALSNQEGETSFETELTKGDVSVIDVELDMEKLDDFNTFYVVSTPVNPEDFYDDGVLSLKTPSLLFYK
ncbi:beta-glucanase/beta-glucan synthetase [Alkalihalobacillus sp. LMS39]|uniref:beta-glucanase/beta-glucan synthetase n=1 Tax=Alkalihalobacillus sp. LMS39 TaxID=2924032 RepID=UPI001FB389C2|nr:beta-glucanase/beta-glucan synthetase [Alkalihalobacillus sp. LMS39]UOE94753.1 beta-glucanase/beta-glucan synthetase [Alkalihalobacillus sp. LMS39]